MIVTLILLACSPVLLPQKRTLEFEIEDVVDAVSESAQFASRGPNSHQSSSAAHSFHGAQSFLTKTGHNGPVSAEKAHRTEQILIVATHFARPDFVRMQHHFFKHYLSANYSLIILNDAYDIPNFRNGFRNNTACKRDLDGRRGPQHLLL